LTRLPRFQSLRTDRPRLNEEPQMARGRPIDLLLQCPVLGSRDARFCDREGRDLAVSGPSAALQPEAVEAKIRANTCADHRRWPRSGRAARAREAGAALPVRRRGQGRTHGTLVRPRPGRLVTNAVTSNSPDTRRRPIFRPRRLRKFVHLVLVGNTPQGCAMRHGLNSAPSQELRAARIGYNGTTREDGLRHRQVLDT
jgi:hypothetical protein